MKQLRWPTNSDEHAYIKERQRQNRANSDRSRAESWMEDKLLETGETWTRNAQWGYRLFGFWCHRLGIAVEVDGPEHNMAYDAHRDRYNLLRSGIRVLRVKNFDEVSAIASLSQIRGSETWANRRTRMGLDTKSKSARRRLAEAG